MARIPVHLPSLLTQCTGGNASIEIEAETLSQCIDKLIETHPLLRVHLFDETGAPRRHVLFFLNDENTRWLNDRDVLLKPGDRLIVLQSVSGG